MELNDLILMINLLDNEKPSNVLSFRISLHLFDMNLKRLVDQNQIKFNNNKKQEDRGEA